VIALTVAPQCYGKISDLFRACFWQYCCSCWDNISFSYSHKKWQRQPGKKFIIILGFSISLHRLGRSSLPVRVWQWLPCQLSDSISINIKVGRRWHTAHRLPSTPTKKTKGTGIPGSVMNRKWHTAEGSGWAIYKTRCQGHSPKIVLPIHLRRKAQKYAPGSGASGRTTRQG